MINDSISAAIIADQRPPQSNDGHAVRAGSAQQPNAAKRDAWVSIFTPHVDDITLVAADPIALLACDQLIVSDHFAPPTVLSGIHAGLFACRHDYLLAAWAAMPPPCSALLDLLLDAIESRFDAVVFGASGGLQPLPAAYSKRCLKPLTRQLAGGDHDLRRFYKQLRIRTIGENASLACDPSWQPFFQDMNQRRSIPVRPTPDDVNPTKET